MTSVTLSHSTPTKHHNILAFHRVTEALAAKIRAFYWIQSTNNLSDMLSKHWDHPSVYLLQQEILHLFQEATEALSKGTGVRKPPL